MIRVVVILCVLTLLWPGAPVVGAADENPFGERTVQEALASPEAADAAPDSPADTAPERTASGGLLTALLNMVAALLLVLALIYLIYRFVSRRQLPFRQAGGIRYVAGYPVGPQKSVQLLEIAGKIYVLGVAENVQLLRVIDDPKETELLTAHLAAEPAGAATPVLEQVQARLEQLKQQRRNWLNRLRRQHDAGDGDERG